MVGHLSDKSNQLLLLFLEGFELLLLLLWKSIKLGLLEISQLLLLLESLLNQGNGLLLWLKSSTELGGNTAPGASTGPGSGGNKEKSTSSEKA